MVLSTTSAAFAAGDPAPVRLAIAIESTRDGDAWRAGAFEQLLIDEAAGYAGVEPSEPAAAELTWIGVLGRTSIQYEIRASDRRLGAGELDVVRTERGILGRQLYASLAPVVREGGALDRARRGVEPGPVAGVTAVDGGAAALGLLVLAALLALPYIVALALGGGVRRVLGSRTLPGAAVAAGGLVALAASGASPSVSSAWAVGLAGGAAWGWFGAIALRAAFPRLSGIGRIEHSDVFRMLRVWLLASVVRMVRLAAVLAPITAVAWLLCERIGISGALFAAVVAPALGIVLSLWWASAVDMLALYLDRRLVDGEAGDSDDWNQAVRGYFNGYVKRAGWPVDESLLQDVLFLPGRGDDIVCYGSTGGPARIVIGRSILEYALAPYHRPHDYAPPRDHELHWQEWNAGLVVPAEPRAELASADQRRSRVGTDSGEIEWIAIGQPPTLAGYVEPSALDERHSYRPTEDPLWLEWDPGDDFDGTDPSDKDFLFGALVRELGAIERREHALSAVFCAVRLWLGRAPAPSRFTTRLADAYASLNYARHHLVQYLAWRAWKRDELLTARALAPELETVSEQIYQRLDIDAKSESKPAKTSPEAKRARARLQFLAALSGSRLQARRERVFRLVAVSGAALAALVALGVAIERAIAYHPTYVDRIEQQKQQIGQQGDVED